MQSFLLTSGLSDLFRILEPTWTNAHTENTSDEGSIEIDMPGVKRDSISVAANNGVLTISWSRGERKYQRNYYIDEGVDATQIEAKLEDGVLYLTIPKPESTKAIQIAVN